MTEYWYEHEVQEHFRQVAARDRQLARWGWFRRHEHHPRSGWRSRLGTALICLGCWLQKRERAQLTRTQGEF